MAGMAIDTFELLDEDGRSLPGHLVTAGAAAVIVVHETFGLNEQMKGVARRLAAHGGLTAFVVDLFGGQTTGDTAAGYNLAQRVSWKAAFDLIRRARRSLSDLGDGAKVGVVGFSFGGGVALAAAAQIPEIAACVSFYGIPTPDKGDLGRIACKVQGHFAKLDRQVAPDRVDALEQKLAQLGVSAELHRYDAQHSFMNEVRKDTYSYFNAEHGWARMLAFLRRELEVSGPT